MSYTYLKGREHYEDRYDAATVEHCRSGERIVNQTFIRMDKRLPASEKKEYQAGWYLMYSRLYFSHVETIAAERRHNREKRITEWMEADEQKDHQLATAQLTKTPYCKTCGKDMEEISRDYMSRDRSSANDRENDILFMFECSSCNKRMAMWQDGIEWEHKEPNCEKCGTAMKSKSSKKYGVITTTKSCPNCGHVETYELDLNDTKTEEDPVDPHLELDRKRFCFDKDMEQKYMQKLYHLLRMAKLELDTEERTEHVDIYEAIKDIKQLKLAQLSDLLREALEVADYRDFKLGDPELGQQVVVGFNCLDGEPDRKEYDSKNQLLKLVNKTLEETNWRLMKDSVDCRLGFLSGRVKAFEKEEDLKNLIEQRIKSGTYQLQVKEPTQPTEQDESTSKYEGMHMREAVLLYFDQLMLGSIPAEITLKSGRVKQTSIPKIYGNMHPLLRVIIPMRDGDNSVPDFIRNYDFKMGSKDGDSPKITKDKLGREIKLL